MNSNYIYIYRQFLVYGGRMMKVKNLIFLLLVHEDCVGCSVDVDELNSTYKPIKTGERILRTYGLPTKI
jgi:hypothetical protein